ncbi:CARDB domain-containing protein, partial [Anabaena sp. CS-542/02]|uniref:CARDB domain-containing protein n=1 Tax=Anabaena sp. CS-542/02 TaxID=3021719 RepID=UPI00232E5973
MVTSASNQPNLVISSLTIPTEVSWGETYEVSWTVTNQGETATTRRRWYDEVYFSLNDQLGNDFFLGGYEYEGGVLAPGESYTSTAEITIPPGFSGTGYILVIANNDGEQTDRQDNLAVQAVQINASDLLGDLPDLVVTSITAAESVRWGETQEISWTVTNQGSKTTGTNDWSDDRIYFSLDESFDENDILVGEYYKYNQQLAPGQSYTASQTVTVPPGFTASGYLLVVTNANYSQYGLLESDITNNVLAQAIQINEGDLPDLIVTEATISTSTAGWGESVEVSWTVTNQGEGIAKEEWYDYIYLSTDDIWDDSDRYVSDFWAGNSPLAIDGSYSLTGNIFIPYDVAAGNYHLLVVTNPDDYYYYNQQYETDKTNNTFAVPITINEVDLPDLVVTEATISSSTAGWGESVEVSWTVTNQGEGIAKEEWYDYIYLSTDDIW